MKMMQQKQLFVLVVALTIAVNAGWRLMSSIAPAWAAPDDGPGQEDPAAPRGGGGPVQSGLQQISHQGVVSVNGQRFAGPNGLFRFAIVDPDSGLNRWTNDGSRIGESATPNGAVVLPVSNGVYSTRLGGTQMTPIPSNIFSDNNLVLRVWFNDLVNGWQQLSPDQPLLTSPYAPGVAPIGTILAWHKNYTRVTSDPNAPGGPELPRPEGWVQCDGQTLNDPASPFHGQPIPNLNGAGRFVRGSNISGTTQGDSTRLPSPFSTDGAGGHTHSIPQGDQGSASDGRTQIGGLARQFTIETGGAGHHSHTISATGDPETRPVNMSVVWIMRVK